MIQNSNSMKFKLCLSFLLFFCLVSCGQVETQEGTPVEIGKASYYAQSLSGNLTSNGETFDPNGYTAAHRTLPFDTKVRVTNLANENAIIVRINDRGPYAKDRIIDLSPAAAKKLGFFNKGVTVVGLEIVDEDTPVDGELVEEEQQH